MDCRAVGSILATICLLLGSVTAANGGTRNFFNGGGGSGSGGGGDGRAVITITESRSVQLGRVVTGSQGGTITIAPDGLVETSSGVQQLDTPLEAVFDLTGEPGAGFSVTLQVGGLVMSNGQSVGVITSATPSNASGQFDGSGNAQVAVGVALALTGASTGLEGTADYTIDVSYSD